MSTNENGLYPAGDAYKHYSENYPYNVQPQFRSADVEGDYPCLSCPPDYSRQAIIVKDNKLVVIKGWKEKSVIDLKNFFVPIDNYAEMEILLEPTKSTDNNFVEINYQFTKNNKVSFLGIIPLFDQQENQTQSDWNLQYCFVDKTEWISLGRILILSSLNNDLSPIRLKNLTKEDLYVKILMGV